MPQKLLKYDGSVDMEYSGLRNQLYNTIMQLKIQEQDTSIGNLELGLDEIAAKLNKAKYVYIPENQPMPDFNMNQQIKNDLLKSSMFWNIEPKENKLESKSGLLKQVVEELIENDDIHFQVQCAAKIVGEVRSLLKVIPKEKDNYKRQLLLLLHEAIKRNYSKGLFTAEQIAVIIRMVKKCEDRYISKQQYYQYDKELYNCGIEVFPAWE